MQVEGSISRNKLGERVVCKREWLGKRKMAIQLIADLYDCSEIIDDTEAVREAAHKAIEYVGAQIVDECIHEFEPIGITYFAIISTSHFSIHTWPEYRYAAIDIFSCRDEVADGIAQVLKDLFGAGSIRLQTLQRNIGGSSPSGHGCLTQCPQ